MPDAASRYFRIHGDNIVECERTLELIKEAYDGELSLLDSPLYKPQYLLSCGCGSYFIELLSGHNRWGVDVVSILQDNGGALHEGADSYITEIQEGVERIIFALEYCSALPAGNNAWQRSGRALSSVMAGIPYLYYTEIGGAELDGERNVKAPRFPNPVVPFSYVSTSMRYDCCCIPVYKTHPSITDELYERYKDIIGVEQSKGIIRGLIEKQNIRKDIDILIQKDIELVRLLSSSRRYIDTLRNNQWDQLLLADEPVKWLVENTKGMVWRKKTAEKVTISNTFKNLVTRIQSYKCRTIGGKGIPVCIVPKEKIGQLEDDMNALYPDLEIVLDKHKDLTVVWINGFKPKGEDSRPDRGLTSLARMVVGSNSNLMSVVYGPAKEQTWQKLKYSPDELCDENGLWMSVFHLSNYVLADSATIEAPLFYSKDVDIRINHEDVIFPMAGDPVSFKEDDTDCAIHQIFAHKDSFGIFEGLCNPPGGDWSGISSFGVNAEYRWTSLPRVSRVGGKRPDHVIQIRQEEIDVFFSIESKEIGRKLEDNVGIRLSTYLNDLFLSLPTAKRSLGGEWRSIGEELPMLKPYRIISIGAFMYKNADELEVHRTRGNLDAVLAFQLGSVSDVHVLDRSHDRIVEQILLQIEKIMTGFKVQVH